MPITRRDLGTLAAALIALGWSRPMRSRKQHTPHSELDMSGFPLSWFGAEKLAFVAYPGFASPDVIGHYYARNRDEYGDRGGRVWKDRNQALRRFNRC